MLNQVSLVFDGQGNQLSRYLYGGGIDQVVAEETNNTTRWFLADQLGTVRDVIDTQGNILNHIVYDSYGQILNQTTPLNIRYGFTGREWDDEVGQYYYRARYYDQNVGRFISEDPTGFKPNDTNLNRYVNNNPISFTDPSGEDKVRARLRAGTGFSRILNIQSAFFGASLPYFDINYLIGQEYFINKINSDSFGAEIQDTSDYDLSSRYRKGLTLLGPRKGNDDKGHLLPHLLGGVYGDENNFFWQNISVNRGAYATFGIRTADSLEAEQDIWRNSPDVCKPVVIYNYHVDLYYNDSVWKSRPTSFTVTVAPRTIFYNQFKFVTRIVTGVPTVASFPNP